MPGTLKKRRRSRKFGTPKDKAKHNVIAMRAQRQLQKQTMHDSIGFLNQCFFTNRSKSSYKLTRHRIVGNKSW
ncbi:Uncharacterized protein HZ326_3307 [Fusarium oxysporum f. sp. albedinis]|nr:Uncharacterized protein HZ326_3307 [Fusarium oxysporum f. sp. albedinis]